MTVLRAEVLPIRTATDVVNVRQVARAYCVEQGLSLVDQTKLVTAASELARNALDYGGGGSVRVEALQEGIRRGVRLSFEDNGPGIADVQRAMQDGFTSGNGMGLGLGGARRLVNEFSIESTVGVGTRVMIARWK